MIFVSQFFKYLFTMHITNLTSHDLVMEIVKNSFIHNLYISRINIMHWKHIWHMNLLEDENFVWHLFTHRFIFHSSTHLSIYQTCFQCMIFVCKIYEPMKGWTSHNFHYFACDEHWTMGGTIQLSNHQPH
jgi:hypothetical protein